MFNDIDLILYFNRKRNKSFLGKSRFQKAEKHHPYPFVSFGLL
ncbi:hypothetical protein BD94_1338 [Elizabethkingia anophelis NUHP1]|uniref:Uncharacterized protein n=1 Tax=Elizabethkingia anophelis NUHP1 TaxID=1338011 RepID=A0A077EEX7_9FLAO|nr:hypothetical protein BD94_1338 [Elizabethkingia anophelis NUHP1]